MKKIIQWPEWLLLLLLQSYCSVFEPLKISRSRQEPFADTEIWISCFCHDLYHLVHLVSNCLSNLQISKTRTKQKSHLLLWSELNRGFSCTAIIPLKKQNNRKRGRSSRYPLIMAVRTYCVWGKVVFEKGSSPWQTETEWLSENSDSYDEVFLMWALCWASGARDGAVGEGKRASCGDTDQIWCSLKWCGAQKRQIKT